MSLNWPVIRYKEIDSTNEEAKRRAVQHPLISQWIIAQSQTIGRGRLGRSWVSPVGNLYATALFSWTPDLRDLTRLPFSAALAVADTVSDLAPDVKPKLKWPNDVRCAGAKISGILIETGETLGTRWVAAGIGINVGFAPDNVGQVTTCLARLCGDRLVDTQMTLETLREAFDRRLREALSDFSTTRSAWLERAEGLGDKVRVNVNGVPQEGVFRNMAADGALVLELRNGDLQTIRAGDVELIREVSAK